MIFFFGYRNYGKVDQCPGLFHVVTEFFHLQFMPIAPVRSYVIFDGADSGAKIGLSGKSVLFAYLRGALAFWGIFSPITAIVFTLDGTLPWEVALILGAVTVLCWVLFPLSYWLSRPCPARAVKLAEKAGLDPRLVAEHFLARGAQVGYDVDESDHSKPD